MLIQAMENHEDFEDDADESERGIDPTGHIRLVVLALLLLVLDGTGDDKSGVVAKKGSGSDPNRVFAWFSLCSLKAGQGKGSSGTESFTK